MLYSLGGDVITATATIARYDRERGGMTLETVCRNQKGEEVLTGEAEILYRASGVQRPVRERAVSSASRAA